MNASLSNFNAEMDYYDIINNMDFPHFLVNSDNEVMMLSGASNKDSIPVVLSQSVALLDEAGEAWQENINTPVEIASLIALTSSSISFIATVV